MKFLFGLCLAGCVGFLLPCQQWAWFSDSRQGTLSFQNHFQQWQSPVNPVEKQQRGIWSIAVLNVPWEVIVVIVASVASKQINLLTCGRKHQRKTMRKFYIILIVLCNFLPTSNLIFHQKTQHWKWPCGEREGEKICWSLLLGFHCELIFLKTLKRHFFLVFYRSFKWSPSEKCTLLRTAQQVIGKYFNSPARTLSSRLAGFVFTSGIRSGLDWQLSQQCSHAGCLDHLWTCFLTLSPHSSVLAWSRDSHKWLWIAIRERFPRMILLNMESCHETQHEERGKHLGLNWCHVSVLLRKNLRLYPKCTR